jgi:hypothetical protein
MTMVAQLFNAFKRRGVRYCKRENSLNLMKNEQAETPPSTNLNS